MTTEDDVEVPEEPLVVWFTPDRTHFYLVPRGLTLPEGDALIRGPLGMRRRRVDLAAMEAWEVGREEAMAVVDRAVEGAVGQARSTLGRLVEAGWRATGTGGDRPGIDEIPDLKPQDVLGRSAGELVADREGARKAVSGLLGRVSALAGSLGGGPSSPNRADEPEAVEPEVQDAPAAPWDPLAEDGDEPMDVEPVEDLDR